MNRSFDVTFFTATYNRPQELYQCFKALSQVKESHISFEWVIVDDGSKNFIEDVLNKIQDEAGFSVRVIRRANGGKSSAINVGVSLARGRWFFIIDDDDFVDENILIIFKQGLDRFEEIPDCTGIAYRKKFLDSRLVGKEIFPLNDFLELKPNLAGELFQGDLGYFFRTSILEKYLFPSFKGENFIPELYLWNKVADAGKIFYHTSMAVYSGEYLSNGLTSNFKKQLQKNPQGFLLYYVDQLKRSHSVKFFIKNLIRSIQCYCYKLRGR